MNNKLVQHYKKNAITLQAIQENDKNNILSFITRFFFLGLHKKVQVYPNEIECVVLCIFRSVYCVISRSGL